MANVTIVSVSFKGEYPTGVYWTIGEERDIDESYVEGLPEGLELDEEEVEASASPMSAEAEAPPEPAEITGDVLDTVDAAIDDLEAKATAIVETTVPALRASVAIARAVIEGTPGDVSEEAAPS